MNSTQWKHLHRYGPWAVVTGASDGIGRAFARELAAASMNVVLVARREAELNALAASLASRFGVKTRVLAIDLGQREGQRTLLSRTADLDIGLLVAAAGFGTSGPFLSTDPELERRMLSTNCEAVMHATHHFAQRFAERGAGGIVLMSSVVAFQGVPGAAHYAATKAYIQTLGEALHGELAKTGVDVICSAPGPVDSGFAARADMVMSQTATPEAVAKGTLKALGRRRTVRPGWLARLLATALCVPRWARIAILTQVMAGMTRHQQRAGASLR